MSQRNASKDSLVCLKVIERGRDRDTQGEGKEDLPSAG